MLSVLNLYCHGYVAVPIIESFVRNSVFDLLNTEKHVDRLWLVERTGANEGYFTVALRALESLGWIKRTEQDSYILTENAAPEAFHLELSEFYTFGAEYLFKKKDMQESFVEKIAQLNKVSKSITSVPAEFQDAAVVVPLMFATSAESFPGLMESVPLILKDEIRKILVRNNWIHQSEDVSKFEFTELGVEFYKKRSVLSIAASYRPMLAKMDDLLFGDAQAVFRRNESGNETHLDRNLNVIGSGAQHRRYFKDAEHQLIQIFNQLPIEDQPSAIADMGCGDGTFLKHLYDSISNSSERRRYLDEFPLTLLGIDYNRSALEETARNLQGYPYQTVLGDINDPHALSRDIQKLGFIHPKNIVHIRSFLDHNFSCDSSQVEDLSLSVVAKREKNAYLDSLGNLISPLQVLSAWKSHLQRWAEEVEQGRLLLLESHSLSSEEALKHLNISENFYFDTIHAFSHQYLICAESFVVLCARVGLFSKTSIKRYPKTLDFCRITLSYLEKRDYIVRQAEPGDLGELFRLEALCWKKELATPESIIGNRIDCYPEGQFVLVRQGKVLGVIYSQRIDNADDLEGETAQSAHNIHIDSGKHVQLLAVNVDPDYQNLNLGDQLLEFMLQRCAVMSGVNKVFGVTLCKEYSSSNSLLFSDYCQQRDEFGRICDPILAFHETHGAKIEKVIANYRPNDTKNEGYGVLISYEIHNRKPRARSGNSVSIPAGDDFSNRTKERIESDVTRFLEKLIKTTLGEKENAFALQNPLMEMGLDSADLLELQGQILQSYHVQLGPAFFFKYNNAEKVIKYLVDQLNVAGSYKQQASVSSDNAILAKSDRNKSYAETVNIDVRRDNQIAIVGISCRLPGGIESPEALWRALENEEIVVGNMPVNRFQWPLEIDPETSHPGIDKGGYIKDVECFDASFFRVSPHEAKCLDPQQRILLELAWTCLESANVLPASLANTDTGVFIGASGSDYARLVQDTGSDVLAHYGIGSSMAVLANRISYFFDLVGPSLQIDTACSSSLVALHQAIQSINSGECNKALVGGINLICHAANSIAYYKAGMLSVDGKCKSFDDSANGYVRAEGAVMMLLKPLNEATQNGDIIHGVIAGSSISHAGLSGGLTVPNPEKQANLLLSAWKSANITSSDLSYIEAHGTGTPLGDPIEIKGIVDAFKGGSRAFSSSEIGCGIGSLKSNTGHLEAAAGIAGLLKVILCFKNNKIVKSVNIEKINSKIDWCGEPLYIATESRNWPSPAGKPRYAGVSSFGSGGANAHVVVKDYQQTISNGEDSKSVLIPLSAHNLSQLRIYAEKVAQWIDAEKNTIKISDLAYTFQVARTPMQERLAFVVSDYEDLKTKIENWISGNEATDGCRQENCSQSNARFGGLQNESMNNDLARIALKYGDLQQLAILWVSGAKIDWNDLYESVRTKINAPTYPFVRAKHWIVMPEEKKAERYLTNSSAGDERSPIFLVKSWRGSNKNLAIESVSKVVVLYCKETRPLAGLLQSSLNDVVVVECPVKSEILLHKELDNVDAVVDLTAVNSGSISCEEVISLLQLVVKEKHKTGIKLLCFTQGLEPLKNEKVNISGARRSTLHRLLQGEYSQIHSRSIDLDPVLTEIEKQKEIILHELASASTDIEVCYRNNIRYVSFLAESTEIKSDFKKIGFSESQVVLITGGTRGIGLLCAMHLVSRYGVKKLVLTGRDLIPPASEWKNVGLFPKPIQEKIRALKDLVELGVDVEVRKLDLNCFDDIEKHISLLEMSFGKFAGIIHAAGITDDENPAFIKKTSDSIGRVMSPKVHGLNNLLRAINQDELKFVLLYSSVSAQVPSLGAGQSDYAMANAFLDYFALASHSRFPIVSIQWPSWKQRGMGEVRTPAYLNTGLKSITDKEGLEFLDRILGNLHIPVLMPAVVDSRAFRSERLLLGKAEAKAYEKTVESVDVVKRSGSIPLKDKDVDSALLNWLISVFQSELGVQDELVNTAMSFADHGADSILLMQIIRKINSKFGLAVDLSVLLEHCTLSDLARWLFENYGGQVSGTLDPSDFANVIVVPEIEGRAAPNMLGEQKFEPSEEIESRRKSELESEAVAVVGMSCRFPGASSVDGYWDLLARGASAIQSVPYNCWGKETSYSAGLIDDLYGIDPDFFMLTREDIQVMDPQALVLLEEALAAIYHAGYTHKELAGKNIGVYVGARNSGSVDAAMLDKARNPVMVSGQNYLAANLSKFFDFRGPSLVIDTACSSALVAMNMAIEAIRAGSIEGALVGGVSLLTNSLVHELFQKRNILKEGKEFHILDQRSGGVVLSEGCGLVFLKPIERAKRERDTIYSIVSSISVNNDGRSAGPATPNIAAQKQVMQSALNKCNLASKDIAYIEINGSGSEVTDLIEIKAIQSVYSSSKDASIYLGSMKPNIGHPLCAEGIAGFIKVCLMLHHQYLTPFLSGHVPLKHFSVEDAGFRFPRNYQKFDLNYAALNCFADGGTNAHVILSKNVELDRLPSSRTPLAVPKMSRVDARNLEPKTGTDSEPLTVSHSFNKSKTWSQVLDLNNHIVSNHKVYGQTILPGLAWIDVICQWFSEAGIDYKKIEIANLSIYRPLLVSPSNSVILSIEAKSVAAGLWKVSVRNSISEPESETNETDLKYIEVDVREVDQARFGERLNIEEILAESLSVRDIDEIYTQCRTRELVHEGVMKVAGKIHSTQDSIWIHVKLDHRHDSTENEYLFHPALIDGCGVGSESIFSKDSTDNRLYLPLFYESFSAVEKINSRCFARVKHSSIVTKQEIISMTMEFFNEEGFKIAELKNFSSKLVRDPALISNVPERIKRDRYAPDAKRSRVDIDSNRSFSTMLSLVQALVATEMEIESHLVQKDIGYYQMGLDSATLLKVVKSIGRALSTSLPPTLLFEYTTIDSLAEYLEKTYPLSGTSSSGSGARKKNVSIKNKGSINKFNSLKLTTHSPIEHSTVCASKPVFRTDIAVIGMSGRYPQAKNLQEYWQNLLDEKNCITTIPIDRWNFRDFEEFKTPAGRSLSKWGGFVDDVDCFDAQFFKIAPKEAESLDPQERIFLEVCWEAIEDAGYIPSELVAAEGENERRPVGVFAGVMHKDYAHLQNEENCGEPQIPLSLNYSLIANRVSYFCNFNGPSITVDTVCSSSLTAVHLAMESVANGESKVALAGGVNLSLHPNKYQTYGMMGLHSSDGRCRTFGEGGDGYVSAEGVGAIVIKSLAKAIADGDSIYAVLKGSSINHVGTGSGITVPSPIAQGEMIVECLRKTGIDPESISYIEAHGTGTSLGDPIEIQGLNRAFSKFTKRKHFCALGSVKSNIGHAESAAGISGLTKTILQLQHKTLVKSLHSEIVNPYLDLSASPFYIQTETQPWTISASSVSNLRRAGVSSFGAYGSNAHIILEEFRQEESGFENTVDDSVLLILSAKNKERLQEYAHRLKQFLLSNKAVDLLSVAFTLQTGRVSLEERLVVCARSVDDAIAKLEAWIANSKNVSDTWSSRIKQNETAMIIFNEDDDLQDAVKKWIAKGKLSKLAQLWVQGANINWKLLYTDAKPKRLRLPTYPFAKERYWVPKSELKTVVGRSGVQQAAKWLHPLLHENTSDLSTLRFTSHFTGHEFFLNDHKVKGEKVLPGVAYLEMARCAVEKAAGETGADSVIVLKNVVWSQAIVVNGAAKEVSIMLIDSDDGHVHYEVCSKSHGQDYVVVNSQGMAELRKPERASRLDLRAIKSQLNPSAMSAKECYQVYQHLGIEYGPAFKGIDEIYRGEGQVLAKLILPDNVQETLSHFVLHPSLLDSALQSSIGLGGLDPVQMQLSLPYALESLEVLGSCASRMFAWIRLSDRGKLDGTVEKLDIDICDEEGLIRVKVRGFSTRQFNGRKAAKQGEVLAEGKVPQSDEVSGKGSLHALKPTWRTVAGENKQEAVTIDENILLIGGNRHQVAWVRQSFPMAKWLELPNDVSIDSLQEELRSRPFEQLIWIAPDCSESLMAPSIIEEQERGAIVVFRILKALLGIGYIGQTLKWSLITRNTQIIEPNQPVIPTHAAIAGLVGSLAKEFPHWHLRLLDIDSLQWVSARECLEQPWDNQGNVLARRHKEWLKQMLVPVTLISEQAPVYKDNGVYVVIGGAGGIGEVWSRYMIQHYRANIVWIGRRELTAEIERKIQLLRAQGKAPMYITADARDADSLRQALHEIKRHHPRINGVVHSAIVLEDQSLTNMQEAKFRSGLSAKVDISEAMSRVFGEETLDFMLFFSSIQSFSKFPGQSNYAAGCTFKDSFSHWLDQKAPYPVKTINWGYWGEVGVVTQDFYKQRMERAGIGSIEPGEGMAFLQAFLDSGIQQVALVKTKTTAALQTLGMHQPAQETFKGEATPNTVKGSALDSVLEALGQQDSEGRLSSLEGGLRLHDMDALLWEITLSSLISIGLFENGASKLANLTTTVRARPFYQRWLAVTIDCLKGNNLLREARDGQFEIIPKQIRTLPMLWREWDQRHSAWIGNPNRRAQTRLLEVCLKALPAILTGREQITNVMFPNASMEMVEGIYKGSKASDYFNEVLGNLLIGCIEQRADQKKGVRILEIGAGTGGTTSTLLPMLQPYVDVIEEYCYTDISKAFLLHAKEQFEKEFPVLRTAIFDVSNPVQDQAIEARSYDYVIATNVLHATPDIRKTLRNVSDCLTAQGVLLVNELSEWSLFTHLTFGLLEGWWLVEDESIRLPGSPGLSAESWAKVLKQEGFGSVIFPTRNAQNFGQQVFAASDFVRLGQQKSRVISPIWFKDRELSEESEVDLKEKTIRYLQVLIAEVLQMAVNDLDPQKHLEAYGLDSIMVLNLTKQLRNVFSNVPGTLLFEAKNISGLAEFFIGTAKEEVLSISKTERDKITHFNGEMDCNYAVDLLATRTYKDSEIQRTFKKKPKLSLAINPEKLKAVTHFSALDVAIIGVSGCYPKSKDLKSYWDNLVNGNNCLSEIPKARWDWQENYDPEKGKSGKHYSRWGGFVEDFDRFDPEFFNVSAVEADKMDPQERLFLQAAYHAMEDAAYTPETLTNSRRVGVYVGVMNSGYSTQPTFSSIPNRVSYHFDFRGPSIAVDTACSSSLTALHLALESLYSGLIECAVVGGVNIIDDVHFIELSSRKMLSKGEACRPFGKDADGFLDAEGIGALILKPLDRAESDGDNIYGVLKGSSINSSGKTNGFMLPTPVAQSELVSDALQRFNISAESIGYIEAHGTGTSLGDAIEIEGLSRAFRKQTNSRQFCSIGSVKSNIGHCESASGIAGITKILLQLKHKILVPSIHSAELNSEINFTDSPFFVQKERTAWNRVVREIDRKTQEFPLLAGICSFGAGGANGFALIQEYIPSQDLPAKCGVDGEFLQNAMIPLSARNVAALYRVVESLVEWIESGSENYDLEEIAHSLQVGRVEHEDRLGIVASSINELSMKLKMYLEGAQDIPGLHHGSIKTCAAPELDSSAINKSYGNHWALLDRLVCSNILDAWVNGIKIDWHRLYVSRKPRRVSLPAYPFEKRKVWAAKLHIKPDKTESKNDEALRNSYSKVKDSFGNADIEEYLCRALAEKLEVPVTKIDFEDTFFDLGITSASAISFTRDIEKYVGERLSPSLLFEHGTVSSLSQYIRNCYAPEALCTGGLSGAAKCKPASIFDDNIGSTIPGEIEKAKPALDAIAINREVVGLLEELNRGNISVEKAKTLIAEVAGIHAE